MRRGCKLLVSVALLCVVGCGPRYEYGTAKTEPGRVSRLVFVPSGHGSDVAVGFGNTSGGQMTTTVTPIDVRIPARYGIVFECEHGTFAVEGEKWKPLWKSLKEGQQVTIRYREIFEVSQTEGTRTFKGFDFLGASPAS